MKIGHVERGDGWELRYGRWEDVLEDVELVDALISDPPYGTRTHEGHDRGVRGSKASSSPLDASERRELSYSAWRPSDVEAFAEAWHPRAAGWFAVMSCDELARHWRGCLELRGRCGFAPLPCMIPGMTVRLQGDGPSSWSVWLNVARPRGEPFSKWGTLRGEYRATPDRGHIGGKPLAMMRAIVRDYTRRTNEDGASSLIVDPCAGGGTTLLAAVLEGRRAIGAEADPDTFAKAVKRLRAGYTPSFDFGGEEEG